MKFRKAVRLLPATLVVVIYAAMASFYGRLSPWHWGRIGFSDLELIDSVQGWKTPMRKDGFSEPLTFNNVQAKRAIWTHAYSKIWIKPLKEGKVFRGHCGYPDEATGAEVRCRIYQNGKMLFESEYLSAEGRTVPFSVEIDHRRRVILEVLHGAGGMNAAHAAWYDFSIE